jgi:hypothetical protein
MSNNYIIKHIMFNDFGCCPEVNGGFSWKRTDLVNVPMVAE